MSVFKRILFKNPQEMRHESLKQIGLKESGILCEVSIGMPVGVHIDSSRVFFGFFLSGIPHRKLPRITPRIKPGPGKCYLYI